MFLPSLPGISHPCVRSTFTAAFGFETLANLTLENLRQYKVLSLPFRAGAEEPDPAVYPLLIGDAWVFKIDGAFALKTTFAV